MDVTSIVNAVGSHLLATGLFEQVNGHEPKSAPALSGLTAAAWADRFGPIAAASGLDATAAYVVMNVRLYTSMLQQPYDAIDPNLMAAVDALFTAYSGDFDLGGLIRNVDLLGAHGESLRAQAGYLNQDSKIYRVMTLWVPLVVNDAWSQEAAA